MIELLYKPYKPYQDGYLKVDNLHNLYYAEFGNPEGIPILFVHGGPGGGFSEGITRYFDPDAFHLIAFDQRGAGKSLPYAEIRDNTPDLLVEDIEKLRTHLGIDQWHIFGHSWGSTLSLLYAEEHPDRVLSLTIGGIFTMRKEEVDWFVYKMGAFFPDAQKEFEEHIPEGERKNLLSAYFNRLVDPDPAIHIPAAIAWDEHESKCVYLDGNPSYTGSTDSLALARIEAHYMLNNLFDPDDRIIGNVDRIRHIPTIILQGQYDIICPPKTAFALKDAFPEAHLWTFLAGHGAHTREFDEYNVMCTNRIKHNGSPLPVPY